MTAINHQNNFATNLTTNTSAGATTSPLNSIPSIAAPFYIAFDATNINGHYEVKQITSKTSTNVNHSALSYNHTTAEEVRIIIPAEEMDMLAAIYSGTSRQALINANFVVNQRGYVSNSTLSAGSYGHDRWKAGASGGDYTFTQLPNSTQITIKTGKSLIQVVEDKNVKGGTYTLSWTGTAQARFGINSATPSGTYSSSPITITTQTAGTVMSVEFNEGTLGEVVLNSGSVALPFQPNSFGEELRACQRYYEKSFPYATAPAEGTGFSGALCMVSASVQPYCSLGTVRYHVQKRIVVTPTLYNPTTANANKIRNNNANTNLPASVQSQSEDSFMINVNNSSVNISETLFVHWTADAEL